MEVEEEVEMNELMPLYTCTKRLSQPGLAVKWQAGGP